MIRQNEKDAVKRLSKAIEAAVSGPVRIMEVCGTHTMSIFRHGIRSLLPGKIELVSGPGCPVCVTSQEDIDRMIALSSLKDVTVATFGDLVRVPGSGKSLAQARAEGADVQIVYSPSDALDMALKNRHKKVVFLGVGFETTAPTVAATLLQARAAKTDNFFVYSCHKLMPPALDALFEHTDAKVDGLICPGHVSTIIGASAYEPIVRRFGLPCVVAGFEPLDILTAILLLVRQHSKGEARVENCYERAVSQKGNERARALMYKVFEPKGARWRGLGEIDESGLSIRDEFSNLDAEKRFEIKTCESEEPKGCMCGQIIRAEATPPDCPLFGKRCTPATPVGPCMVSSEGTCSAYFRYGNHA